jgi:prepilin-type N-terminal cleavage/methylation domain-containing protein
MERIRRGGGLRPGFTLIEVLIVIIILGILAAVVVPAFSGMTDEARKGAFIRDLKTYADAIEIYTARTGYFVADSSSGEFPPELDGYLDAEEWERGTPLGGVWDVELMEQGITSGVGVHFQGGSNPGNAFMADVDARFDDGDLTTGLFRRLQDNSRFYYVMAD